MLQHRRYSLILPMLLLTGCASHADDAKLQADMVILTQKMQALSTELVELKAKQAKQQQLAATLHEKNSSVKKDTAEKQ